MDNYEKMPDTTSQIKTRYVIITPAKNEEKFIENTLQSVIQQTILPEEWIIVNDQSTDATKEIAFRYANKFSWIKVVTCEGNNIRSIGGNIVRVFQFGLNMLEHRDFDFIVKLDADLTLPREYFEIVLHNFNGDSKLGICGGVCGIEVKGRVRIENAASYHVRGPIKAYRKECYYSIGGLIPIMGWDGLDEFTAMQKGWKVKLLKNLVVIHHRPTGSEIGQVKYSYKSGISCYNFGYDIFLTALRALRRMTVYPYLINGIALYLGYFAAFMEHKDRVIDDSLIYFIKKFQYQRIKTFLDSIFVNNNLH